MIRWHTVRRIDTQGSTPPVLFWAVRTFSRQASARSTRATQTRSDYALGVEACLQEVYVVETQLPITFGVDDIEEKIIASRGPISPSQCQAVTNTCS